jgi:arginine decarboxylase
MPALALIEPLAPFPIRIASALSEGPTELAAFDAALRATGVANFNLIRLSSVVPSGSVIEVDGLIDPSGRWGDRLYVVYAEARSSIPGQEVWAGIGWVQDPVSGAGLFVEHEGCSESFVRWEIEASLTAMCEGRGQQFGPIESVVTGGVNSSRPICAFVVAVFASEGWNRG